MNCIQTIDPRYCRKHGKCVCVEIDRRGHRAWSTTINPSCPLHGPDTQHNKPPKRKTWNRV